MTCIATVLSVVTKVESSSRLPAKSGVPAICSVTRNGRSAPKPSARNENAGVSDGSVAPEGAVPDVFALTAGDDGVARAFSC